MEAYHASFETKLSTAVAYGVAAFLATMAAASFVFAIQIHTDSPFGPNFTLLLFVAVAAALVVGYRRASRGVASRAAERRRTRRAVGFVGLCVGFFLLFNVAIGLFVSLGSLYGTLSYGVALTATLVLSYLLAYRLDLFN